MWRVFALASSMILILAMASVPAQAASQPMDKEQIRQFLKDNPQFIMEILKENKIQLYDLVLDGRRTKQRVIWLNNVKKGIEKPLQPYLPQDRPWRGPANAPIVIVEYSDFLCPACRTAARNLDRLLEKHADKFRLLLKHNASSDFSKRLAVYFEAIARQDPEKAWRFYKEVMKQQSKGAKMKMAATQEIVNGLELDQGLSLRDLADKKLEAMIKADAAEAERFRLTGTPNFIVGGVPAGGALPPRAFMDVYQAWQAKKAKGGGSQ